MSKVKQNKMSSILDKFGLNSTKHQLLTPATKKYQPPQQSTHCLACSKTQKRSRQSNFSPPKQQTSIKKVSFSPNKTNKKCSYVHDRYPIDVVMHYLKDKMHDQCKCPQHDKCGIKFICLQQNCKNKLGCAHCFLSSHHKHHKAQLNTVINSLKDFKDSYLSKQRQIQHKLTTVKSQVLCHIDQQLNNIRSQFENSLHFLERKVYSQIDSYFREKYYIYAVDIPFNMEKQFENQKQLLRELIRWKPKELENKQVERLQGAVFQKHRLDCFRQYFQQMNSSISQTFSAFKRSMPKIFENPPNYNAQLQLIHNTFHDNLYNRQRQIISSGMNRNYLNT